MEAQVRLKTRDGRVSSLFHRGWVVAGARLPTTRCLVGTNLIFGLLTIAIGASARFWAL